jgi:hypothetical protein
VRGVCRIDEGDRPCNRAGGWLEDIETGISAAARVAARSVGCMQRTHARGLETASQQAVMTEDDQLLAANRAWCDVAPCSTGWGLTKAGGFLEGCRLGQASVARGAGNWGSAPITMTRAPAESVVVFGGAG